MIESVEIGRAGLPAARVGFGCAPIGGYDYGCVDDAESVAAIHAALDHGCNLYDIADVYGLGHAESILGLALRGRRDRALIAGKVGVRWLENGKTQRDLSPTYLRSALEASLTRLGTEYIDLYQIHWPAEGQSLADAVGTLAALCDEGKVRAFGVCNLSPTELDEARASVPVETLQASFSVVDRASQPVLIKAAEQYGMRRLTYNTLAHGLLSGKYGVDSRFEGTDLRTRIPLFHPENRVPALRAVDSVREVAAARGKSPTQVAIRWALDSGLVDVALTGIKTAAQAQENLGALGWHLSEEEMSLLADAAVLLSK